MAVFGSDNFAAYSNWLCHVHVRISLHHASISVMNRWHGNKAQSFCASRHFHKLYRVAIIIYVPAAYRSAPNDLQSRRPSPWHHRGPKKQIYMVTSLCYSHPHARFHDIIIIWNWRWTTTEMISLQVIK